MGLKKHLLSNKPLCISVNRATVYIGDTCGCITACPYPFIKPTLFHYKSHYPISSICFHENSLFYTNWNGEIARINLDDLEVLVRSVEDGMIKCCRSFGSKVFLSVNFKIYTLGMDLNIIDVYEMKSKVLSMEMFNSEVYCGMSMPYISIPGGNTWMSKHDTSILDMTVLDNKLLTASADHTIREFGDKIIFQGKKWVRSFKDGVFSEGENVWTIGKELKCIYSHKSDVSGVGRYKGSVFSIGFDHFFCVYNAEEFCFSDEEKEIEKLLAETKEA